MRLNRLDLSRYGRFTDRSLSFNAPAPGAPDLHIIYGPNEAGKSTLFSAWLDLLFGIPLRTRYDFLHPGPTMQIAAQLTHDGATLDLKRMKRSGPSLFDRHDAPLPEAVLQSKLGGLSRDGYSAMFSLDDETLEKGGDGILASRGDLGEMLFSASAGLAGLAPQLDALRSGLDSFHRTGKRSGWLYDAKKQLTDLERQRRELDVSAGALQKLTREASSAEHEWREARMRDAALHATLERLQQLEGALPLLARLSTLETDLGPLQQLPDADPVTEGEFKRIDGDRRDLSNRIRDRALRLQGLKEQLAAVAADPDAVMQSAAIAAAEALRPEHDTALKDIPRRQDECDTIHRRMTTILAQLGQQDAPPGDLCLTGDRIVTLRDLLAVRSGVMGAVATATAETRKATAVLSRESERLGDPGPAEDEAALTALIARLRAQDPSDLHDRALRDRDLAQGRLETALAALAPWQGDGDALAALAVPPSWQIDAWERGQDAAQQHESDARREAAALCEDLNRLHVDATSKTAAQSATGITLAEAAAVRSQREALWATHLGDLSPSSARRFEQALREDDRISALLGEAQADARRQAQDQATQQAMTARLKAAETRLDEAMTMQRNTQEAIDATCATLALRHASLADLKQWLGLRIAALTERTALRDAETAIGRSAEARDAACRALGAALGKPAADAAEPFETLLARAVARIEASERRREARQRLLALANDLRERRQAEAEAQAALTRWMQNWRDIAQNTILANHPYDDAGLGTVLDLLDQLGVEYRAAAALKDRIDKMDANRHRFISARNIVLDALGLDENSLWADVQARLRRAQDSARDHATLTGQIASEQQQDINDRRGLAARDADAATLGATLGWDEHAGSLADHIALCRKATILRSEIASLREDLRNRPLPAEGEDLDAVRQDIARLKADQLLARDETETRFTAHLEAKRRIEAIGGDDALARITATRENLLLDIRERATTHLAKRFGLLALEAGLRRYRDQHRSTMLTRASEAFSRLSRGAYSGLAAQPDGAQEVLVAIATNGGAKLAADMSKGTRFQLYLALRIAGYHELAQSRPTVPFIADDIMETFDDDRSAAAFSLLTDMSRVGQVIYLTHHRHLCEIALSVCPGANVIDLQAL